MNADEAGQGILAKAGGAYDVSVTAAVGLLRRLGTDFIISLSSVTTSLIPSPAASSKHRHQTFCIHKVRVKTQ